MIPRRFPKVAAGTIGRERESEYPWFVHVLIFLLLFLTPVTGRGRTILLAPRGRFLEEKDPGPNPLPLLLPLILRPSGPNDERVLRRLPFNMIGWMDVCTEK